MCGRYTLRRINADAVRRLPAMGYCERERKKLGRHIGPRGRRLPLTTGLKPYWGKPAVRNLREVRGSVLQGLVTICPEARKGGYIGSHWPKRRRASFLLDERLRPLPRPVRRFSRPSRSLRPTGRGEAERPLTRESLRDGMQGLPAAPASHPAPSACGLGFPHRPKA
jgi:hypothetical protein